MLQRQTNLTNTDENKTNRKLEKL